MSDSDTPWFKSTKSGGNGGSCVETRRHNGMVEVRDSKDPTGPVLTVSRENWRAFISAAKAGDFDI
ncbi:MAG TPA: DUF397 domain-containing protein [Rugosimonospora sp.]|nr:DUF397 domain-containing protein [Rugosimonospora sp.]